MPTLSSLIRNECANHKRANCIFQGVPCPVISGAACNMSFYASLGGIARPGDKSYFEAAVLTLAKQMPQYSGCVQEYADICGRPSDYKPSLCECGSVRAYRQRFCDSCKAKKAKESTKKYRLANKG